MKRLLIALGISVGLFAGQAQATHVSPYPLGTLSNVGKVLLYTESSAKGTFTDTYNFVVDPAVPGVDIANVAINLPSNFLHISNPTLSVYSDFDGAGGFGSLIKSGTTGLLVGTSGGGNFSAVVSGTADGIAGGAYTIAVAAVPLPASVLLLASGLVGLVGVSARRRRKA